MSKTATTRATVRVCGPDRMCFDVDARTLKPLNVSCYDAWCFSDPQPGQMSLSEWNSLTVNGRIRAEPPHEAP